MPISNDLKDAIKHAEGVRYIKIDGAGFGNDPTNPDYQSESYVDQMPDVSLCREVYGGTKTMRECAEKYLPQGVHEHDDEYKERLKRATLYPAFERTVHGLVGMILRKDPMFEEGAPDVVLEDAENVDLAGRPLSVFARDLAIDAMIDGHAWALVEYPRITEYNTPASLADERERGLRPYWCAIKKADALNWRYEMRDGRPVLTMFVYRESVVEPVGAFGEEVKERVRVLTPGAFEVWERADGQGQSQWTLIDEGATSLGYIPVAPFYTNRTGHFESKPPLLGLAYENVNHWQTRSDRQYALKFAGSPFPVFSGADPQNVEWGMSRALFLPDSDANAQLLESSGASLQASREELQDIEARMASLGLQMLVRETRAAETAQAKLIDKAESDSALSVISRGLEGFLNDLLEIHATYRNIEPARLTVNRDFNSQQMEPSLIREIRGMVADGQLPMEDMWSLLQAGELLPPTFDVELAQERLLGDGPALLGG
jgi:hypothetical protein